MLGQVVGGDTGMLKQMGKMGHWNAGTFCYRTTDGYDGHWVQRFLDGLYCLDTSRWWNNLSWWHFWTKWEAWILQCWATLGQSCSNTLSSVPETDLCSELRHWGNLPEGLPQLGLRTEADSLALSGGLPLHPCTVCIVQHTLQCHSLLVSEPSHKWQCVLPDRSYSS